MPIIKLSCARRPGVQVGDRLIQRLTEAVVEELKVPQASVNVLVEYVEPEDWAVGGERLSVKFAQAADTADSAEPLAAKPDA